jgi:hypothetical protein
MVLDGARVLEYAPFDDKLSSGGGSAVVGGVAVDLQNVSGVVIVQDLATDALFLLHCNRDWETIAAVGIADVGSGRAQAEAAFPGVAALFHPFRGLTAEEQAEIASTRAFLRELLADDSL